MPQVKARRVGAHIQSLCQSTGQDFERLIEMPARLLGNYLEETRGIQPLKKSLSAKHFTKYCQCSALNNKDKERNICSRSDFQ
jgi:hypothetical protein